MAVLEPFTKYPYLQASLRKIPILIERERLDELLNFASYVVCSAKFPQPWTGVSSIHVAFVSMLQVLQNLHATTNGSRRLRAILTLEHRLVSKTPPKFSGDVVRCMFPSFCMNFRMRFKYIILGHYTVIL
ncbi:hypothetical protein BDA96_07G117800 [Sorghum bicolor]|uniref:Uncharacterized protein n=1 Tax=Sorghum bicolor TaxID=4558 RepID=A0A921QM03_SORBI|nr:hypothetical protein BDA96_07G117800 [Sorghum bicolor]